MRVIPILSNQRLYTTDSPTFAGLTLGATGIGELTCGSINRASGSLTLEIGGTAEVTISSTTVTLGGNLIIPDAGYIGSTSGTTAIQIEADGDLLLANQVGIGITPAALLHLYKAATTGSTPLELLRLEVKDEGVELAAGMGPAINFYMPHDTASFLGASIGARKESATDDAESTNLVFSTCPDTGSNTVRMRIGDTGLIGIGADVDAGTLLQLALAGDAYLTLQNLTDENSEGGCETRLIFEDHDDNTLVQIEGSHSGTGNDYKGKLILSTNTGSGVTAALTINDTQLATFSSNILIPNAGYIGSASATTAIQIETDGDILLVNKLGVGITPAAVIHAYIAATTASSPLEVLRLECKDAGVDLDAGMGPAINFYLPEDSASFLGAQIAARKESAVDTAESTNLAFSTCPDAGSSTVRMRIGDTGLIGIGLDVDAGTLLQLALDGNAYLTLQNLTAENGAGGAETKIIFEDHGNNALGQIEVSHVGASDDEKGQFIISTNTDGGLTTALTISDTQLATFASNILIPNAGYIGAASMTTAIQIETDGDILLAGKLGVGITPAAPAHVFIAATTASSPLEVLRLECNDGGVELDAGMGAAINFYLPEDSASFLGAAIAARKESNVDTAESTNLIFSTCPDAGSNTVRMRIGDGGEVGIGLDVDAGTLLQLALDGDAYLTLQNLTAENSEGGAETRIIFEDHDNNALMQIEGSHSGSADDAKGKLIISTNTGSGLTAALTISDTQLATFTSNILIPDAGYIGSASDTTALQIEADGDILLSSQLGIGVTPGSQIEIAKAAANATLTLSCYHDTEATTPLITMRKADNTLAAPALVDDHAVLGTIHFDGYDGSGWHTGAKIEVSIQGEPADGTNMPTEIAFWTCPQGSATLAKRLVIDDNGYIGISMGNYSPSTLLHMKGVDAYISLQNSSAENGEGGAETRILFLDHVDATLAQIEGSHSGTSDDTKGKFVISTNSGGGLATALTITDTLAATFAGAISATNYTAANLLTACASSAGGLDFSGAYTLTVGGTITISQSMTSTSTPTFAGMELTSDSASTELIISAYHNTEATTPLITLRKAEGTAASHATAIDDDSVLGTILFQGYDSNSWANGAKIEARVKGDPADGDMPTELTFWTTADGGSETPVEQMTIGPDGAVVCTGTIAASNYTAAALLTACASNAGGLDFSAGSLTLTVAASATIGLVIDDLNSLGAPASDGQFIVATGVGAFAYESTTTARTSLGVGTGDSPAFAAVSLGTGELTAGSVNRASGTLLLEIAGTPELSISSTVSTFGGNIVVPDAADIGSASATNAISISGTGIVDIELHNLATIGLALAGTLITASAAELNLLDGMTAVQAQADVLDDIIGVGTVTGDSYFLVGTGAAAFAWETTTTVRTSLGLGTGDSPTFAGLIIADGGTVGQAAGPLLTFDDTLDLLEITGCSVGIGVTDPDELLELYKVGTQLKLSGGAADYATFAVAADGALTITTVDAAAAAGDICLMPDGKVGINDAAPGEMLDVGGNANLTGVLKIDDVQVVMEQQANIGDATTQDLAGSDTVDEVKLEADLTAIVGVINSTLDLLEAHGLMAGV